MKIFTVIGFYTDNGQRYVEHLHGNDPADLPLRVANQIRESITIVAIIEGEHTDVMDGEMLDDTDNYRDEHNTGY